MQPSLLAIALGLGLLIIAPGEFHPALEDFVAWKRAQGLDARLVPLEDVLRGDGTGGADGGAERAAWDDPEKVKRAIAAAEKEWGARYVLLVGDADRFPIRYMLLDRSCEPAFDVAFYPSDLYYADLYRRDGSFDDWNASREGYHAAYFGEVHGEHHKEPPINFDAIDYRPDVAVGRWPASTADEVARIARKTIRAERATLAGETRARALLVSTPGLPGTVETLEDVAASLPAGWIDERRYFEGNPAGRKTRPPTRDEVRGAWAEGVALVAYDGHGSADGWHECFALADARTLAAEAPERLPVVLAMACDTAQVAALPPYSSYVDATGREHAGTNAGEVFREPPPAPSPYQPGAHNLTSLGERLLREGEGGAAVYIGCTTGGQPCANALLRGFGEALGAAGDEPRAGDLWAAAVAYYHGAERLEELVPTESWYPASIFFQGMKYIFLGDPSLRMPGPVAW